MIPCEKLEAAFIEAALNLAEQSQAHAFSLPVPNTTPRLFVALFEEGAAPPGVSAPSMPSSEWLAEAIIMMDGLFTDEAKRNEFVRHLSKRVTAQVEPVRMLTEPEIKALTAMVWGAPCSGRDLAIVTSTVRAMEALKPGERPIDPANGGRLLDVDACIPADGEVRG